VPFWTRQEPPEFTNIYGMDTELEIMMDIIADPVFQRETTDLVPIVNLNCYPEQKYMDRLQELQQIILARLVMKMIYKGYK
jgi:predicted transcriptional regulator